MQGEALSKLAFTDRKIGGSGMFGRGGRTRDWNDRMAIDDVIDTI